MKLTPDQVRVLFVKPDLPIFVSILAILHFSFVKKDFFINVTSSNVLFEQRNNLDIAWIIGWTNCELIQEGLKLIA